MTARVHSWLRTRLRRYDADGVLVIWTTLTVGIVGYVLAAVLYEVLVVVGIGLLLAASAALAVWTARPLFVLGALVTLGFAVLSIGLACPGVACAGPERLRIALGWTALGPRVSLSTDPPPCAFDCPYTVELLPLFVGYLLVGEAVGASSTEPSP